MYYKLPSWSSVYTNVLGEFLRRNLEDKLSWMSGTMKTLPLRTSEGTSGPQNKPRKCWPHQRDFRSCPCYLNHWPQKRDLGSYPSYSNYWLWARDTKEAFLVYSRHTLAHQEMSLSHGDKVLSHTKVFNWWVLLGLLCRSHSMVMLIFPSSHNKH